MNEIEMAILKGGVDSKQHGTNEDLSTRCIPPTNLGTAGRLSSKKIEILTKRTEMKEFSDSGFSGRQSTKILEIQRFVPRSYAG